MRRVAVLLAVVVSLGACGGPSEEVEEACGDVATLKERVNELAEVRGDLPELGSATGAVLREARTLEDEARRLGVTRLEELAGETIEDTSDAAGVAMTTSDGEAAAARIDPTVQEMIAFCREAGAF